ncbi:S1 family peptidase [Propylenella binzhouense]|nr:serine protease [Propylenella binzhouense]
MSGKLIFTILVALSASLGAVRASAEGKSAQILAAEATTLYQAAAAIVDPQERGRLLFLVEQRLDQISTGWPQSVLAAQIAFGQFEGIDVARLRAEAEHWAAAHPSDATALASARSAAGPAPDRAGGLVPHFGGPPVPSFLPDPAGTQKPPAGGGPPAAGGRKVEMARLEQVDLVRKLRDSVAFIYDPVKGGWGTAFFIDPTHVMTNTHVVAGGSRFVVANRSMGVKSAHVLFKGMNSEGNGIDTAVLEMDGWSNPAFLAFAQPEDLVEGESVTIGGYPGLAQRYDKTYDQFISLIDENSLPTTDMIPNVKFDFGYVQSIFVNKLDGTENVQNSITGTGGYSGSPIINQCGYVVAQHYFSDRLSLDPGKGATTVDTAKFSYALSAREVTKFLRAANIPFTAAPGMCPTGSPG